MNCARIFTGGVLALLAGNALAGFGLSEPLFLATGNQTTAIAIGDVTGDGRDDVIVTNGSIADWNSSVFIFVQQADGTLQSPLEYSFSAEPTQNTIALADFDGDGLNDIIIGYIGTGGGISWLRGSANSQFSVETLRSDHGYTVSVTDFDNDGNIDLAAYYVPSGTLIFFGDGEGNIARQVQLSWALGNHFADVNLDGFDDLVTPGLKPDETYLYLHDGVAGLEPRPQVFRGSGYSQGFAAGDFNDDGRGDLAVIAFSNSSMTVYYDAIYGQLALRKRFALYRPRDVLAADIDQNGRDDLLADSRSKTSMYLQDDIGLQDAYEFYDSASANVEAVAVGDVNGDGLNDVVNLTENGARVRYGQNELDRPDLLVTVGANAGAVAVQLENAGGGPIDTPLVAVDVSVSVGTLQSGVLPEGCVLQTELPDAIKVECLVDTMQPGAVVLLQLPISVSQTTFNVLNAAANADTDTSESRLQNNQARKTVWLGPPNRPAPAGTSHVRQLKSR